MGVIGDALGPKGGPQMDRIGRADKGAVRPGHLLVKLSSPPNVSEKILFRRGVFLRPQPWSGKRQNRHGNVEGSGRGDLG